MNALYHPCSRCMDACEKLYALQQAVLVNDLSIHLCVDKRGGVLEECKTTLRSASVDCAVCGNCRIILSVEGKQLLRVLEYQAEKNAEEDLPL